jgi:hypothetical protein
MRRIILAIVSIIGLTSMITMGSRYRPGPTDGAKHTADEITQLSSSKLGQPATDANQPADQVPRTTQPGKSYLAGYALGECLAAGGCQVFEATIQTIGEPRKQGGETVDRSPVFRDVLMTVDQNLAGPGNVVNQRVRVESVSRPRLTKTAAGPWNVWENVQLAVGAKVFVALWGQKAQRATWEGQPDKVAVVTSDLESFSPLREIVQRQPEFEARPENLLEISRRGDLIDQYWLGYLMAYVTKKVVVQDVDTAAKVFSLLLGNEAIPEFVRDDIPARLLVDSYRLSEKARDAATKSLIVAAATDNAHLSEIAIDVLIQLSNDKHFNMQPFLTPDVRPRVLANYQSLLARRGGSPGEHRSFETQIGIGAPN